MADFDFDLFVIGAGSGGVRAARIASAHGARVAIAEEYRFGGTCVIRGCVPKKLLVYASRFRDEFEDAAGFGWTVPEATFDWTSLIASKDGEIARLEAIYKTILNVAKVEVFAERAIVAGAHTVHLPRSNKTISAAKILIATGAAANVDTSIDGSAYAMTSNEAFQLTAKPDRITIVGGGYIALEFAGIFNGLGSKVTLVHRGEHPLRGFDEDVRDLICAAMRARGIDVVGATRVTSIAKTSDGLAVSLSDGRTIDADQVMFAIGRAPNTVGLGLADAGVSLKPNGAISVSKSSQTSVPSIFAVGDVTDRVALTPVAIREGHAFADSEFGGTPWTVDYATIPTAVFSTPEIGTVGLAEHEARALSGGIDLYKASFRPMKAILAGRDERMFMKLIVDRASQKVLGLHVIGADAAEIVQMAAIALRLGATKADFDATIALHPSAAEELVTLRERWIAPGEAAG